MFSIIEFSGHQYKVALGQIIDVDNLADSNPGSNVDINKVLFIASDSGSEYQIGAPVVNNAKVIAKVIRHDKSKKVIILKRRPGKYVHKTGHRQQFTSLLITEIHDTNGKVHKIASDHKNALKFLK
jgi:large subunit ribosomal protein L21